jgi:hypothetical protein
LSDSGERGVQFDGDVKNTRQESVKFSSSRDGVRHRFDAPQYAARELFAPMR